jgi:predicted RNase H-like nuclease (RuvC/YqgF family)
MESETRPLVRDDETIVPDLVDRIEHQAAELARLQAELQQLRSDGEKMKTELTIARRWVHTLAREVELADIQLKEVRPLRRRIVGLRTQPD